MEDNNTKQEKPEQFKKDFSKAIFETIRLWCTSEYEHKEKFQQAYYYWVKADENKKENIINIYLKDYKEFLSDYSIGRNIGKVEGEKSSNENIKNVLKIVFNYLNESGSVKIKKTKDEEESISLDKHSFDNDLHPVDYIASIIQKAGISSKIYSKKESDSINRRLPISLVAKSLFLKYPDKVALYDTRVCRGMKKVFKSWDYNDNNDDNKYINYYSKYSELISDNSPYKVEGIKIIEDLLSNTYKSIIINYFEAFFEFLEKRTSTQIDSDNSIIIDPYLSLDIMEIENKDKKEFLYQRSLDKYLWYLGDPNKE